MNEAALKTVRIELIPTQSDIFNADLKKYRTLIASAGEQGGKTILGALWMHFRIDDWKDKPVNFVVGAPTYKILEQSTRPTFMKLASPLIGSYDGKDDAFRLKSGGSVYFRSATDPDSVVGIPDCVAGWIDEAGKCSRMFYLNIQGRVARMQGTVICTSTPYALNWLYELIREEERGERPDILYRRWPSCANPSYPQAEYDRLKSILPPRVFRMRVEGIHEKAEGMIHEGWDDLNWATPFPIPKSWPVYGGIDWGFDHPTALSIRAINPYGYAFGISFFKRSGLSTMQVLDVIEQKSKMFGVKIWYCGHDRPDMIQALQERGIAAVKYFEHSPNYREVRAGDQKLSEMIFRKRYRVFKDVDHWQDLEDEYQTYVWEHDDTGDKVVKERPVNDGHAHDLMAAERYVTVGTLYLLTEEKEKFQIDPRASVAVDRFDFRKSKRGRKHWSAY